MVVACCAGTALGDTRCLPPEAVFEMGSLKAADFRAKYPGQALDEGASPSAKGWYVHYRHGGLAYFFGPLGSREAAQVYRDEFKRHFDDAAAQRPALSGATLEVLEIDGSQAASKSPAPSAPSTPPWSPVSAPVANPASQPTQPTPPAAPPESIWARILRFFGFG